MPFFIIFLQSVADFLQVLQKIAGIAENLQALQKSAGVAKNMQCAVENLRSVSQVW